MNKVSDVDRNAYLDALVDADNRAYDEYLRKERDERNHKVFLFGGTTLIFVLGLLGLI